MKRIGFILTLALVTLAGCEALTAHTSVAARAGSQELSTERLAQLIGNSTVPLDTNAENNEKLARAVADVWVNYQLIAYSAARDDSLRDFKKMDAALWQQLNGAKSAKFRQEVAKTFRPADTVATEAEYNQGELLSAAHILFMFPQGGGPPQADSVKREAERIHKDVTTANFADMVKRYSKDSGSLDNKGLYAAFPRGAMAKEFEDGVLALKPGEISRPIQTVYGYHIIRRPLFDEVKADHSRMKTMTSMRKADSAFMDGVHKSRNVQVKKNAPALLKDIAQNLEEHRNDRAVIATYRGGRYLAADFARLIRSIPQRQQIVQQVMIMPDTMVETVVKDVVFNDQLLPKMADSAKLGLDSAEINNIRGSLTSLLTDSWRQLGVEPASLGDSSANEAARIREAATRVDAYVDGLMNSTKQYIAVLDPLENLLRANYSHDISTTGLKRAMEQAVKVRAKADSARAQQMKDVPSAVPMPGDTPPGKAGGAPPTPPPPTGRGGG